MLIWDYCYCSSFRSILNLFIPLYDINGLVQERRNSIANALELRLSCTNPSICSIRYSHFFLAFTETTPRIFYLDFINCFIYTVLAYEVHVAQWQHMSAYISWWCYDIEMLFTLLASCEGNPPVISRCGCTLKLIIIKLVKDRYLEDILWNCP